MEETNTIATHEEMVAEAIKRLSLLNLHKDVLKHFKNDQTLYYSERSGICMRNESALVGVLYWIDNREEFSQAVAAFEEKSGGVVYHATYEQTGFGRCLDLFYVSPYKEEWAHDREDLLQGYSLVYAKNFDDDLCSEYGSICFACRGGGLVRTA